MPCKESCTDMDCMTARVNICTVLIEACEIERFFFYYC